MASRPKVRAFLFCDAAIHDTNTGKTTVVGTFDYLVAPGFPAVHGSCALYCKVTEMNGTYRFSVRILAPDLETVVAESMSDRSLAADDPLRHYDYVVNLSDLLLVEPGRYAVQLLYSGKIEDQFSVEAIEQP
jgi:hypothetical protein